MGATTSSSRANRLMQRFAREFGTRHLAGAPGRTADGGRHAAPEGSGARVEAAEHYDESGEATRFILKS
jgi:hypothetical protein